MLPSKDPAVLFLPAKNMPLLHPHLPGQNLMTRVRGFRNLMQYCNNLNRYVLQKKQEIPDAGLQEWEEENEVTPVARQVAEQVMHASEAEASVVHRLQNQLTK